MIGDGAFTSGIVFEAMSNTSGLKKKLLVILNDNKMSICPRVGGLSDYLDRLRMGSFYTGLKAEVQKVLGSVPLIGDPFERFLSQIKDAIKAGTLGGMFFEELGFTYIGPVDGHNIRQLQRHLERVRDFNGPVLMHIVTEKGHGFEPAVEDPVTFHTPAPFRRENGSVIPLKKSASPPYTEVARDAILDAMRGDGRVVAITAAMCQGNMLEPVRDEFPRRFFDVGICESHAVAFAAGLAKSGLRPIVDIYSTFLPAELRPDLPGSFPPKSAGDHVAGPSGPHRPGRADPSRHVRSGLSSPLAEPRGHGPGRFRRFEGHADVRPGI